MRPPGPRLVSVVANSRSGVTGAMHGESRYYFERLPTIMVIIMIVKGVGE